MPLKQNGPQVLSSYKGGTSVWLFLLLDYLWETFSPVNSSAIRLLTYVPVIYSNGYTKELILYFTGLILQGLQAAKHIYQPVISSNRYTKELILYFTDLILQGLQS